MGYRDGLRGTAVYRTQGPTGYPGDIRGDGEKKGGIRARGSTWTGLQGGGLA